MNVVESSMLEAISHSCTEVEIREFLQNLTSRRSRRRLETHGHVAVLRAIESNDDAGVVLALLERPEIQVNQLVEGNTLLHTAVQLGNKDATEALLKRGDLDPNVQNLEHDTPLHLAAKVRSTVCQDTDHRLEILALLINDPRVHIGALNGAKQTAFHVACKREEGRSSEPPGCAVANIELILSATETRLRSLARFLRLQDAFGRSGLHYASESGMLEVVSTVLDKALGSRDATELALTQDREGKVAAHFAAEQGHLEIVDLLLNYGDAKDAKGLTTLHYAVRSGRHDVVKLCLTRVKIHNASKEALISLYLELLPMTSHHTIAIYLLSKLWEKLVASHVDEKQYPSLLHWAVENKDLQSNGALIIKHILTWQPERANEFLDKATESTPLHRATKLGNVPVVKALCSETNWYLNANQRDKHNNTALNYAFEMNNQHICRVLMHRVDVKEHLSRLHKYRETYVIAANAILVVAVLIATLTYLRCPTLEQAVAARLAGKDKWFRQGDILVVTRIAFLLSMASTILGAFAALPFSFGFFFTQTVDDNYVGKSVKRTRILIVLASYFLVMSLVAVVFAFVCSQYIAPYLNYEDCERACEVVVFLFLAVSAVFMVINIVRCCNSRRRRARSPTGWRPLMGV